MRRACTDVWSREEKMQCGGVRVSSRKILAGEQSIGWLRVAAAQQQAAETIGQAECRAEAAFAHSAVEQ